MPQQYDYNLQSIEMGEPEILGIVVAGGTAPGLNGLISAAAEYALRLHWKVIGFQEGYKYLSTGDPEIVAQHMVEITEEIILKKAALGGSVVKTDRTDISKNPAAISNSYKMLRHFKVRYLLSIGGNAKLRMCHYISQGIDPTIMQVIAVPKTISNDVQLPPEQTSLGFQTARAFGAKLCKNLCIDAQSEPQWYIIETMGKETGHLAYSIGEASGVDLTLIPEDFPTKEISLSDICDIVEGCILKKKAQGINYGCVLLCEGLYYKIPKDARANNFHSYEHETSDIELCRAVAHEIRERFETHKIDIRINSKKIGYELRGCKPLSFDAIYARELGVGAINGFLDGHSNCICHWYNGSIFFRSFKSLINHNTGEIEPRYVDTTTNEYKKSHALMTYLVKDDFANQENLKKLAEAANTTPAQFLADFAHIPDLTVF
ncbi:Phosphofructokinase family protein [Trichomonas vaginalis G3]|uniref:Phosphofructokinase family protein n=1 Tax=Trichomonas vaginalis (strain ATCC PRA-98 / G3) TaxID=412133 RepID=A2FQ91_TRIV3|nr:6-phosphofructokinase protein [Trichomonas vaginalis G3]EAX92926.1 Phosphofructokinase family protein [Trichomonas vaginalis G3]KAI5510107.1 6-phosphofructokinase protein [Trichomonas vaginalis G3]|eukprot:XP_001305856.1 Phosphofructokinase family protein [Trichomonas vaginalis G3]